MISATLHNTSCGIASAMLMPYTSQNRYLDTCGMAVVQLEPTKEHPVPYDLSSDKTPNLREEIAVAGNTAELQEALGAPLDVTERDAEREKELLRAVAERTKPSNLTNHSTAFAAASFLRTYGQQLAMDAAQARAAITHKLMEIANCGDPRYELKALELLGKHSDIGIFTERSEITINYKNPEELEQAIKNRVKNLLNAQVVDVLPLEGALDEKLGVLDETKEMRVLDKALGVITPAEDSNDDIPL